MHLDGICKLAFRSSKRRRRDCVTRGYKHYTPPGWEAVTSDWLLHVNVLKICAKNESRGLKHTERPRLGK
jgi:hypothetical protein